MLSKTQPVILCVDDNPDWLAVAKVWLGKPGYQVLTASSCAEALKVMQTAKPALVLLDVLMPEMDGFEFCAQLQSDNELALIPVIFLTILGSEQDKAKGLAAGGVDYLAKPVDEKKLLQTVRRHLLLRDQWSRLPKADKPCNGDLRGFIEFLTNTLRLPPQPAASYATTSPGDVYALCGKLGVQGRQLARQLAAYTRRPHVAKLDPQAVELGVLPAAFCRARHVVPLRENGKRSFALSNPLDWALVDALRDFCEPGEAPRCVVTHPEAIAALFAAAPAAGPRPAPPVQGANRRPAPPLQDDSAPPATLVLDCNTQPTRKTMTISLDEIESELGKLYHADEETIIEEDATEESAPIIMLVNRIIEDACEANASDIHIEPWEREVLVRYRIDGNLRVARRLRPQRLILPIVARIKIMSSLNITDKRLPQDGRIACGDQIDMRVATSPMQWGEKVVLRILDKRRSGLPLEQLGFSKHHLGLYRKTIHAPYGMILHVGPTGSGKSMSLFAALKEIQNPETNIQTIEDPIEYTLPGVNQLQVRPEIGLTFARALRSFLRQDPDVILVGEMRDSDTADAAVQAALTGHLLLSTLHTNDAASTITRLTEMGVEPYLVSSSLLMVCAQRLLRCLCGKCRFACEASEEEKSLVGARPLSPFSVYRARGCPACGGSGFHGRTGVHELMLLDDTLRAALVTRGVTADAVKRIAVEKSGMTTLYWDAMMKARQAVTSVEEVLANVRKDDFDSQPAWMREPYVRARPSRNTIALPRVPAVSAAV